MKKDHHFHCKIEVPITELPITNPLKGDENDGPYIIEPYSR